MALCRVPVCTPAYPRNVTASAYETVFPRAVVPGLIKWNAYLWSHWLGLARLGLARLGFGGCRGVHVAGFEGLGVQEERKSARVGGKTGRGKGGERVGKGLPRQRPRRVWLRRQALQISMAHFVLRLPAHAF